MEKLAEKNIEELIVLVFAKISHILHFLAQIIEVLHDEQTKIDVLKKLQTNKGKIITGVITKEFLSQYYEFIFNYKTMDWLLKKLGEQTIKNINVLKIIINAIHELTEIRNSLAHGGFLFNNDELEFHREIFNPNNQKFESDLNGCGRKWLTENILKADDLFKKTGIIATQLRKGEQLDEIISLYFDKNGVIMNHPFK